jgi:hypothetical protein
MTLVEWTAEVSVELQKAGFEVREYKGFPLVPRPASHEDTVRLIKFRTLLAADRSIYLEGMLFVPAGSRAIAEKLKRGC